MILGAVGGLVLFQNTLPFKSHEDVYKVAMLWKVHAVAAIEMSKNDLIILAERNQSVQTVATTRLQCTAGVADFRSFEH